MFKQECIPVGCVPPASALTLVPVWGKGRSMTFRSWGGGGDLAGGGGVEVTWPEGGGDLTRGRAK